LLLKNIKEEFIMNKKGISLVALVITIIVLIILTAAVVITGINVPSNAEEAVANYNLTVVQDAVTIYAMNQMFNSVSAFAPSTAVQTSTMETILAAVYGDDGWTANAPTLLGVSLSQAELNSLFTLNTSNGKVAKNTP
jgi:type II secretory pathway pseudopilin PulG